MSKSGAKPKFTESELAEKAMISQLRSPLLSEGAICGKLGVNREYIAEYAKRSELISRTRKELDAIRQAAWEERGHELMKTREGNATVYIWMTRNILGWRDKQGEDDGKPYIPQPVQMSSAQLVELVKKAREGK